VENLYLSVVPNLSKPMKHGVEYLVHDIGVFNHQSKIVFNIFDMLPTP
jgi:hypothetical protein